MLWWAASWRMCHRKTPLDQKLTVPSMPGFLEVYGYFDNEAETWAIDVSLLRAWFYSTKVV